MFSRARAARGSVEDTEEVGAVASLLGGAKDDDAVDDDVDRPGAASRPGTGWTACEGSWRGNDAEVGAGCRCGDTMFV